MKPLKPTALYLYRILELSGIQVQIHADDSTLWRLTNLPTFPLRDEPLKKPELFLTLKSALNIIITVTKDPFIDVKITGLETSDEELIVFVEC